MTKEMLEFELLGYMSWLGGEGDKAQQTPEQHAKSAMSLLFAAEETLGNEWFRPLGKMKQLVSERSPS